jgi:hypothetical protein
MQEFLEAGTVTEGSLCAQGNSDTGRAQTCIHTPSAIRTDDPSVRELETVHDSKSVADVARN